MSTSANRAGSAPHFLPSPNSEETGGAHLETRQREGKLAGRVLCLLLCGRAFSRGKSQFFFFFFLARGAGCFHQKFQLHSRVPKELESGRAAGSLASPPLGLLLQTPSSHCVCPEQLSSPGFPASHPPCHLCKICTSKTQLVCLNQVGYHVQERKNCLDLNQDQGDACVCPVSFGGWTARVLVQQPPSYYHRKKTSYLKATPSHRAIVPESVSIASLPLVRNLIFPCSLALLTVCE